MTSIKILNVTQDSPAANAGIKCFDEIISVNGVEPRDILEYSRLVDADTVEFKIKRQTKLISKTVVRTSETQFIPEPIGLHIESAVFDKIRTCDNKCEFCFIYQLPKQMRKSLYVKDDDFRLSYLYGNFTTLTRFTEFDLNRVIEQNLSPLFVSIHATNPDIRQKMLRNERGASSLIWLSKLLELGIEVHGQIVLCPGINDYEVLEDTLETVFSIYNKLRSVAIVPLGVSKYSRSPNMKPMSSSQACDTLEIISKWQNICSQAFKRKIVYASDELYLIAGVEIPDYNFYEVKEQLENGVGLISNFRESFRANNITPFNVRSGFFQQVDGAPAIGYRAITQSKYNMLQKLETSQDQNTAILTGGYTKEFLSDLLKEVSLDTVGVIEVENRFFGGNIKVSGLMTFSDISRTINENPKFDRYLIPDCALSDGRFIDDFRVEDLPANVEVVTANGLALAKSLGLRN